MEESPKRTRILTIAPCASCLSKHLQLPKLPKRGEIKEIRKSSSTTGETWRLMMMIRSRATRRTVQGLCFFVWESPDGCQTVVCF